MTDEHASALERLGAWAGIEPFYWDVDGGHHETSDDTRRALLDAMGYPAATEDEAQDTLDRWKADAVRQTLAPVYVVRGDEPVALTIPPDALDDTATVTITLEDGGIHEHTVRGGDLDGHDGHRLMPLPADLPWGYHHLRVAAQSYGGEAPLIVAPDACYLPDDLHGDRRIWGVACQLYALRRDGDGAVGDFTALGEMGAAVARHGGQVLGLSPLHAPFLNAPRRASPYAPSSRMARNALFIDVTNAPGFSADPTMDDDLKAARKADLIDYATVATVKLRALGRAFHAFTATGNDAELNTFIAEGGETLARFCVFEALSEHFGGKPPRDWPAPFARPDAQAVGDFAREHTERIRFFHYVQWVCERQLGEAAAHARRAGLALGFYGDLAVGAAADGADAWLNPDAFVPGARIGAPPDPFSATGQDWGIPPLHPRHLRERAYAPFIAMLRANMRHMGALRIDHAMWLRHVFWIPPDGDGRDGAYVRYPMDDLMKILALESHRHGCVVVGEDLGTVPEGFRERMAAENMLSYRLLAFERHADGLYKRPDTYPRLALATAGSHDLPPVAGFWRGEDIAARRELGWLDDGDVLRETDRRRQDREKLVAALVDQNLIEPGFPTDPDIDTRDISRLIDAVHRFMGRTPSAMMMMNVEDVLGLTDQVNIPGTVDEHPNWRRRLAHTVEQIATGEALARAAEAAGRER